MKNAALGFRVHSGWSALVAVSLQDGEPLVLCRRRTQLVETFTYEFRQPYHTAEKMGLEKGREFIAKVRTEAGRLARQALREVQADLETKGYRVTACALLLASGRPLPKLENILASHSLIHTADGELFRGALTEASEQYGVRIQGLREKQLMSEACRSLGKAEPALRKKVTEMGRPLGAPWSQDEKYATLAAWLALATSSKGKRPRI